MSSTDPEHGRARPTSRATARRQPARVRSAMLEPADDVRLERIPPWSGWAMAVLLPLATALALIPFRDDLQQGAAMIMIVPVLVVAVLAGAQPAVVAALTAGASFGVLLTQPYGQFAIHSGTDVVTTIVLLLVGLVVGAQAVRAQRLTRRAELRHQELEHLIAFAELNASAGTPAAQIAAAADHLEALLSLERCEWHEAGRDPTRPAVLDDGQIMGYLHDLPADRSELPEGGASLVVQTPEEEFGSFLLVPAPGTRTSTEQRRTAAVIANLLALTLERGLAGNQRPQVAPTGADDPEP